MNEEPKSPIPERPDSPVQSDELLSQLYRELRSMAESKLSKENPNQTLTPTELVHEAYLKLNGPNGEIKEWDSLAHFWGSAARAMRCILVDIARKKHRRREAGAAIKYDINLVGMNFNLEDEHQQLILDLDDCLMKLAETYPNEAALVDLRFFAGLTMEEAAEVQGISRRTGQRRWAFAKAQLQLLIDKKSC